MLTAKTDRLVQTRVSRGWNKSDLARRAHVCHSSIVRIEQGEAASPRTAKLISDALGYSVLELFDISPDGGAVT